MLSDKNSYKEKNPNLTEIFNDLKEFKYDTDIQSTLRTEIKAKESKFPSINFPKINFSKLQFSKIHHKPKNDFEETIDSEITEASSNISFTHESPKKVKRLRTNFLKEQFNVHKQGIYRVTEIKLSHIFTFIVLIVIAVALSTNKNGYASSIEEVPEYEINGHAIDIQNIIAENADVNKVKEQVVEEHDVEFGVEYGNAPMLPKGEEVLYREGVYGIDRVTAVRTYDGNDLIDEVILNTERLQDPQARIIAVGTSEFLAKNKVHIDDIMYFVNTAKLKKSANSNAEDVTEVKHNLDVKLLELPSEEWAKVSYDGIEGYIPTSNLTSSSVTPNILDKNRIQRILLGVNINMELNKSSKLTLEDFKKIFTGLPNDAKQVFQNNYNAFYDADKKYNINGIFLASIAAHESAWGTSQIANDKKNLFGYGSYDRSPYSSSFDFADYREGIETVAKSLVKYYLNPPGTPIYDDEVAQSTFYNGSTIADVNKKYASDQDWHKKVFNYMETLYGRLEY